MSVKSRIEQQIIGAVLSGRTLPPEAELLRPMDLEHPIAGIILGDVQEIRGLHPAASGAQLAAELVRGKECEQEFGIGAATLTGWCQPEISDPELGAGIRMFLRLGVDNQIAGLSRAVRDSLSFTDDGVMTGMFGRELDAAISRRWDTLRFIGEADPACDQLFARYSQVKALPVYPDEDRLAHEQIVLAGLLTNPGLAWTAAGIINESLFSSAYHREVYQAIDHIDRHNNLEYRDSSVVYHMMRQRSLAAGGKPMWEGCPEDLAFTEELLEIVEDFDGQVSPRWTLDLARQFIVDDLHDSLAAMASTATAPLPGMAPDSELLVPPSVTGMEGPQLRP